MGNGCFSLYPIRLSWGVKWEKDLPGAAMQSRLCDAAGFQRENTCVHDVYIRVEEYRCLISVGNFIKIPCPSSSYVCNDEGGLRLPAANAARVRHYKHRKGGGTNYTESDEESPSEAPALGIIPFRPLIQLELAEFTRCQIRLDTVNEDVERQRTS